MSYQVNISDEAERDLNSIFEYIAYELLSVKGAVNQLSRLEKEIKSLNEMPERYRQYDVEPWCSLGVRRFPVGNYCVFYLPNKETHVVDVIRVLYARSDMDHTMTEFAAEHEQ